MERNITGLISESEKKLAEHCIESALGRGAAQVRISLSKSILDTVGMLNGETDKVTHSADRSIFLYQKVFVIGYFSLTVFVSRGETFFDCAPAKTKNWKIWGGDAMIKILPVD